MIELKNCSLGVKQQSRCITLEASIYYNPWWRQWRTTCEGTKELKWRKMT